MLQFNSHTVSPSDLAELIQLQHDEEVKSDLAYSTAKLEELQTQAQQGNVDLPHANRIVAEMFEKVCAVIDQDKASKARGVGGAYRNWLRAVPTATIALISIRVCLKRCLQKGQLGEHTGIQSLGIDIGRQIEIEARVAEAAKVNPLYMARVDERIREVNVTSVSHIRRTYQAAYKEVMKGEMVSNLSSVDALHIGKFGVNACWIVGLIDLNERFSRNRLEKYYTLNEEIRDYLLSYTDQDVARLIDPDFGAMLCPPDPWKGLYGGGYLTPRRKSNAPLVALNKARRSVRDTIKAELTPAKMPRILKVANYLQSIPYRIHQPTLDLLSRVWRDGGGVMGIPHREFQEEPAFPFPLTWDKEQATPEELTRFSAWKRAKRDWHYAKKKWLSRAREISGLLRVAHKYTADMWFPVYLDTRGRWYYRGTPNPQGSQIAKSVLHFSDRKPLGKDGVFWLKVHIANSFGFDKDRMEARASWVDRHWANIEKALDNPEDHPEVWGDENPMLMFAAAWELREAYRSGNPETYETGVPVHMDATCSGIQHFAALLKDPVSAKYVNLEDNGGPVKSDIYAAVATASQESLVKALQGPGQGVGGSGGPESNLGPLVIGRPLAKRPCMTYVYGVTMFTTMDYVQDHLDDEYPEMARTLNNHHKALIASKLFDGVATAIPATVKGMEWLQAVVREVGGKGPISWVTPSGFRVHHDYQEYSQVQVQVKSAGMTKVVVREFGEGVRPKSMVGAISPNFIHGNDSAHLTLTAEECLESGIHLSAVHDSFGTHPCDVPLLNRLIRKTFVNMYSDDVLARFAKDVGTSIPLPEYGNFDITKVLSSEFFFG